MFQLLKKKKLKNKANTQTNNTETLESSSRHREIEPPSSGFKASRFFTLLKRGLTKSRDRLITGIASLLLGKKQLDPMLLQQIEILLLSADVGVESTQQLLNDLTQNLSRKNLKHSSTALHCLRHSMYEALAPCAIPLSIPADIRPYAILVVGINGSGKTTLIAKLTHHFKQTNHTVLLAAGDTFRAAAIEQLQSWGQDQTVPVIAQQPGADTAAVIYDAMAAAKAREIDIMIADTAGRLHTQTGLMAELQKVKRVLSKLDPHAPHEILLVLDAMIGQNTLIQAKQFQQALGVTGLALTKLDGTAKGGIIFALAKQTKLPIRYLGVGEGATDLQPFDANQFIQALFSDILMD